MKELQNSQKSSTEWKW